MDLKRKIASSFVAVGMLAAGLSSWTVVEAAQSRQGLEEFRTRIVSVEQSVARLQSDFLGYDDQMNMVTLVVATSPDEKQLIADTYAQATKAREAFTTDLGAARAAADDPEIMAALDRASTSVTAYDGFARSTWSDLRAGRIARASKAITVDNASVSNDLTEALADAAQGRTAAGPHCRVGSRTYRSAEHPPLPRQSRPVDGGAEVFDEKHFERFSPSSRTRRRRPSCAATDGRRRAEHPLVPTGPHGPPTG